MALGAPARSSGSSASVRRTTASKFTAIVRRMFSQPPSANVARKPAPALLTSSASGSPSPSTCSRTRAGASSAVRSAATWLAGPGSASASARSRSSRRATSTSVQVGLGGQPVRGGLADPARRAGDDGEAGHADTIACSGNGARSLTNASVASTRSSQPAISGVLARVRADVGRAVRVGVERDVGDRVVVAGQERPPVGEPARQRRPARRGRARPPRRRTPGSAARGRS